MIPPRSMIFVGDGDFRLAGEVYKLHFIDLGGLRPGHRVLDVGCGIGRMAIPLTGYLSGDGRYEGFDAVREGIEWCQSRIASKHPNFRFRHVDVHNKRYNPAGKARARDVRFPFEDDGFDFVFLTSVFTHMLPADLERYLAETARVLKPGRRCLVTMFLLNEESKELIRAGGSSLDFKHEVSGCLTVDADDPEHAIAYDEGRVRALFASRGLRIVEPIRYGSWCRKDSPAPGLQDIIIASKSERGKR
ncbi:MAG: methyltransferase domain-containing protein [Elusimicrobia bacterium]|nr:methyltransferase domain-containing protein [Elusimicrobiota bacterium]